MIETFQELSPVLQALIATTFTWGVTALGAACACGSRALRQPILDLALAFAGGVMLAACFWALLDPAIAVAEAQNVPGWWPAVIGFTLGGLALRGIDVLLPHLHLGETGAEGRPTHWRRSVLLILAITLHNIPEGLAVGVSFGAVGHNGESTTLTGALLLTLGMGLQNFIEGAVVALPLRREGLSRRQSFWYGQLSAIVEPIGGVMGAAAVTVVHPLLPYALSFAAGAMIFVVIEEVIPEAQRAGHTHLATFGIMGGFALMMVLNVGLG